MMPGKLQELDHNLASDQAVVKKGESLSSQDVDGVFLHAPITSDMLRTTLLSNHEETVPSLMTGSLHTSPAPSDSETASNT